MLLDYRSVRVEQAGRVTTPILLVVLVVVAIAFFSGFIETVSRSVTASYKAAEKSKPASSPATVTSRSSSPSAVPTDPAQALDLSYALPYDKRISSGLRRAMLQHLALYARESPELTHSSTQVDTEWYEIRYEFPSSAPKRSFVLRLSNRPKESIANLDRALELLQAFSGDLQSNSNHSLQSNPASEMPRPYAMGNFDQLELLEVLGDVSARLHANRGSGTELYNAAEILSWLAYFKQANENQTLRDLLAERAVSNYLLAASLSPQDAQARFSKGLLLLGMGFPAASERTFQEIEEPGDIATAVLAYIHGRPEAITSLFENGSLANRLGFYLRARTYDRTSQHTAAAADYTTVAENYPGFLLGLENFLSRGGVGFNNRYLEPYIEELLSVHFKVIDKFTDTTWIGQSQEFQTLVKQPVSPEDAIGKWLQVHSQLLRNTQAVKVETLFLDKEFIVEYLREEMLSALELYHEHQLSSLGRLDEAQRIVSVIRAAYPESETVRALHLRQLVKQGDLDALEAEQKKFSPAGLTDFLIMELLKGYGKFKAKWPRYPESIPLMHAYGLQVSPKARTLMGLSNIYRRNYFKPYQLDAIKAAIEADPYNSWTYSLSTLIDDEGGLLASGEQKGAHIYGYQVSYGQWLYEEKRYDEAIPYLEKAIEIAPRENDAYKYLGRVYRDQNKHDLAIATWQAYLDTGDRSLRAGAIQRSMAELYFELGEYEKANEVYEQTGNSGQASALVSVAKATEKAGKIIAAEKQLKRAAKRYPDGWVPVELALFYWRQGNIDTALDTIRAHKRYASYSYYHERVIEYFSDRGQPETAVQILRQVEGEGAQPFLYSAFAHELEEAGHWELAVDLLEPLLDIERSIDKPRIHYVGVPFYDYYAKHAPESTDRALKAIVRGYGDDPLNVYFTAISLNSLGHHAVAVELLERIKESDGHLYAASLQAIALAWRLGEKDPNLKNRILKKAQTLSENAWHREHVMFLLEDSNKDAILKRARGPVERCELYHDLGMIDLNEDERERGIRLLLASIELNALNCGYRIWAHDVLANM